MTQITSTRMTRTITTRVSCTSEHGTWSALFRRHTLMSHAPHTVGSDTMPVRHRADFKEALSTLRRLKNQEDQAYYQNWWQSSSSSWWNWQESWWHPSSETSPRRWTQH